MSSHFLIDYYLSLRALQFSLVIHMIQAEIQQNFFICVNPGGGPLPFVRLKVNHLYNNSMSSSRPEVSNVTCHFGVIDVQYDRLLEAKLLEMFGTPSTGTSGSKKFEDYSARPQEINLNLSCPRLVCELRFQALEVANVRKELRPDALMVSLYEFSIVAFYSFCIETIEISHFPYLENIDYNSYFFLSFQLTFEKLKIGGKISNDSQCHELKILFQSGAADYLPNKRESDEVIQLAKVFSDVDVDDDGCGAASILIQVSASSDSILDEYIHLSHNGVNSC